MTKQAERNFKHLCTKGVLKPLFLTINGEFLRFIIDVEKRFGGKMKCAGLMRVRIQ